MKSLKALKFALMSFEGWSEKDLETQDPYDYGIYGDIAAMLANVMQNDLQIVVSHEMGKLHANGSWSGLIGLLNRSEADISIDDFLLNPEMSEGAAFLFPIEIADVTFATKRPTPTPNPTAVFHPFSMFVWLSLAVSILSMTLAYLYFFKNRTFCDSLFSALATVLRQPSSSDPKTSPERIVFGSWLFGMTIITSAYLGLLLSYLTFPNLRRIENVLELSNVVEKGDFHCYAYYGNSLKDDFLNSSIKTQRIIGKNLIGATFEKFRQPSVTDAAFIAFRSSFKLIAQELIVSKHSFFPRLIAYATRKDYCCRDKLNWAILRLIETGLYDYLLQYYFYDSPNLDEVRLTRNLTLSDFRSIFIMLLVGYAVSLLVLLLEIWTCRLNHLKKKKAQLLKPHL